MDCSYFSTVIYIPKKGDDAPHKDMFSTCTTLSCSCTHWSSPLLTTPPHKQIIPSNSQLSVHGSTPNVTGQSPNLEGRKDFKPDRNTSYFYVIPLPPPPPPPKNNKQQPIFFFSPSPPPPPPRQKQQHSEYLFLQYP